MSTDTTKYDNSNVNDNFPKTSSISETDSSVAAAVGGQQMVFPTTLNTPTIEALKATLEAFKAFKSFKAHKAEDKADKIEDNAAKAAFKADADPADPALVAKAFKARAFADAARATADAARVATKAKLTIRWAADIATNVLTTVSEGERLLDILSAVRDDAGLLGALDTPAFTNILVIKVRRFLNQCIGHEAAARASATKADDINVDDINVIEVNEDFVSLPYYINKIENANAVVNMVKKTLKTAKDVVTEAETSMTYYIKAVMKALVETSVLVVAKAEATAATFNIDKAKAHATEADTIAFAWARYRDDFTMTWNTRMVANDAKCKARYIEQAFAALVKARCSLKTLEDIKDDVTVGPVAAAAAAVEEAVAAVDRAVNNKSPSLLPPLPPPVLPSVVQCPRHHPLQGKTLPGQWLCDARDRRPGGCAGGAGVGEPGQLRWRCADCDFDLCEKCHTAQLLGGVSYLPPPPQPPSPPPSMPQSFCGSR